ncbi:MAG: VOC family protein [Clostridiales bacterium]|nr:VOC family protein [Clostridiales bacterium]
MKILSATLALPVNDLAKSKEWYRQLFEYPTTTAPAPGVAELALGPIILQLHETQNIRSDKALRLGVKDLDSLHKRLRAAGLPVEDITLVPEVIRYFDFKDPDGNGLSFYQMLGESAAMDAADEA